MTDTYNAYVSGVTTNLALQYPQGGDDFNPQSDMQELVMSVDDKVHGRMVAAEKTARDAVADVDARAVKIEERFSGEFKEPITEHIATTITELGQTVLNPPRCRFERKASATVTLVSGADTNIKISDHLEVFNSAIEIEGNSLVVPADGLYEVTNQIHFWSGGPAASLIRAVVKKGSTYASAQMVASYEDTDNPNTSHHDVRAAGAVELKAGDRIWFGAVATAAKVIRVDTGGRPGATCFLSARWVAPITGSA